MKISIIIPIYNVAPYLRTCLESVLAQTYANWEAVCIDDGSTDGSGQILDEMALRDNRIRVHHVINGGVSAARNLALDLARGEIVGFVDADDVLSSQWLEAAVAGFKQTDADIIRFNFVKFEEHVPQFGLPSFREVFEWDDAQTVMRNGIGMVLRNGHMVRCFYRRNIVRGLRFPVGVKVMEDCAFQLWTLVRAQKVVEFDYKGYGYRSRPQSAVHTLPVGVVDDKLLYFAELRRWMVENRDFLNRLGLFRQIRADVSGAIIASTITAISHYRGMRGRMGDYQSLAQYLSEMRQNGLFVIRATSWDWRLPMWLYIFFGSYVTMLIRWKMGAAVYRLGKLWRRR